MREFELVLCIVVGCGRKIGKQNAKFSKIPKIITNQGEEWDELTRERRNRWISAVSRGDTEEKDILESERFREGCRGKGRKSKGTQETLY